MRSLLLFLILPAALLASLSDATWPQKQPSSRGTLVHYRPVIESWRDHRVLVVRQATSFLRNGETKRLFGSARIAIDTRVDAEAGTVTLGRRQLLGLDVPGLDDAMLARAAAWRVEHLDQDSVVVPTTQLLTWVDRDRARTTETKVVHPRPRVYLRTAPARLVLLDGPPVWFPTEADGVAILANSDTLVVRAGRRVYLHTSRGWVEAPSLAGPWAPRRGWPSVMLQLPPGGAFSHLQALFEEGPAEQDMEIVVSHHEVEMIRIDGPPRLEAIPGTRLQWVTNTEADLFTHPSRRGYFLLVSGRWFHIEGSDDLGEYVSQDLPEDFRRIPADHPRSHVLACVPGTSEAEDARLATEVPRYRTTAPGQVEFAPRFEGDGPRWRRIPGTPLDEATNTSQDVLRLGDRWLGCERGLWFESRTPGRSWQLVKELPVEIASIPVSSSKHRLTYIELTPLADGRVRTAVRGGYFGTFASGGVVVHGTGHEVHNTPAFYRDALRRIRSYYDEGAADPMSRSRPSLLEPFYQRTYGYGFQYDPTQALFRPTRSRFVATQAPRPRRAATAPLSREEHSGQTIYPAADGRLYRRGSDTAWERLGPTGWVPSEPPPSRPAGPPARAGRIGMLPPAPERQDPRPASSPPPPTPPATEAATAPEKPESRGGVKRIGAAKTPKIAEGYDAYRWTNKYEVRPPTWTITDPVPPPFGYYPQGQYPTLWIR